MGFAVWFLSPAFQFSVHQCLFILWGDLDPQTSVTFFLLSLHVYCHLMYIYWSPGLLSFEDLCVAGFGTSFLFVHVGSGCLATYLWASEVTEGGQVWKEEAWEEGLCLFSSVGGASRRWRKYIVGELATSLPFILTLFSPFLSLSFSSSFLFLSEAHWCPLGPKNLWSELVQGSVTSWKETILV